jgi:hypothetical protein
VEESKRVKTGRSESSKEGYGSKWASLPTGDDDVDDGDEILNVSDDCA